MKEEYKLEDFKSELHSLCDFGCFYHCSIGGQQKPDCIETFKNNKMKEELEKLGFYEYEDRYENVCYELISKNQQYKIDVRLGNVYFNDYSNTTKLFPYNHEKLKQLIKLLS